MSQSIISRRSFGLTSLASGVALALPAGAQQAAVTPASPPVRHTQDTWPVPPAFMPTQVRVRDVYTPGEIHVDPNNFALYFMMPDHQAIRYTVGIAKGDLYESGSFVLGAKKEWPSWKPTPEMVERNPAAYSKWKDDPMPGGKDNPLGARALYLFVAGAGDSMLRIHGTPQPWTIGSAVSNGCVRLVNDHIIDLYNRAPMGARIVLYPKTSAAAAG